MNKVEKKTTAKYITRELLAERGACGPYKKYYYAFKGRKRITLRDALLATSEFNASDRDWVLIHLVSEEHIIETGKRIGLTEETIMESFTHWYAGDFRRPCVVCMAETYGFTPVLTALLDVVGQPVAPGTTF